jgi:predicted nucleotidyltransferase
MKEMKMLDLSSVDIDMLVMALEDHSYDSSWWFDPTTGNVEYCSVDDDPEEFESRHLVPVGPEDSREAYQDMVDFTDLVGDAQASDLLFRALQGRGAFRRFKDTLFDLHELREEWFSFHDRRMRRRAIEWLADRELIAEDVANRAITGLGEEPESVGPLGAMRLAELAADELRRLYGDRLAQVLLYGSHARGDAGPESDIDLLVVLRDMGSPWDELRRMDDLLWRLSLEHGVTLSALPVTVDEFEHPAKPVLIEARSHGKTVV